MEKFEDLAVRTPEVQLPRSDVVLKKWAVIACDQFTSEPEYWRRVEQTVGDAPSTLHLMLPEIYLEQAGDVQAIRGIHETMQNYLDTGVLQKREGLVFVERTVGGRRRSGVMLCVDLERYDYNPGSTSLIRASEGTIVERLPARMKIRQGAALELPHILVLIDDPGQTAIEPLQRAKARLEKLYDFELMLESGHLTGYGVSPDLEQIFFEALAELASPKVFASKYGTPKNHPVLLFATGDGNHSLAAAKAVWEGLKPNVGADHPARFALVEIENVHDAGLEFHSIHRVLFNVRKDVLSELRTSFGANLEYSQLESAQDMLNQVDRARADEHTIGLVGRSSTGEFGVIHIKHPGSNIPLGSLQPFLDRFLAAGGADKIDYVHGQDSLLRLGAQSGNAGFYLPAMRKSDFFKTVILDGALPRKTFSMGEAREKRFYMEARKISTTETLT